MGSGHNQNEHHHHILSTKTAIWILAALLVLTVLTVVVAHFDFGAANLLVALFVATVKGTLVALFFMGLFYDHKENGLIFSTGFLFLIIFIVLASTDTFFRGDVKVKGEFFKTQSGGPPKFKQPWVTKPEMLEHAKVVYTAQCASCHGDMGRGDGPAAGSLNPKPRNFLSPVSEWKNGRKPTQIYATLTKGLGAMPMFPNLPPEDRWALAHYVRAFGSTSEQVDTNQDLAQAGIDLSKEDGGVGSDVKPTLPIDVAMKIMSQEEPLPTERLEAPPPASIRALNGYSLYQASCVQCHGNRGEGMKGHHQMGANPAYRVIINAKPFVSGLSSLSTQQAFNEILLKGIPGRVMPSFANLSELELRDLYQYVRAVSEMR